MIPIEFGVTPGADCESSEMSDPKAAESNGGLPSDGDYAKFLQFLRKHNLQVKHCDCAVRDE